MSLPQVSSKASLKGELECFEALGLPSDMLLVCSDGVGVRVHSQIVQLASGVLRSAQNKTLKVEGSSSSWKLALEQLYPLHPRPPLSFFSIQSMLKIVHQYDMASLLAVLIAFLLQHFPAELSPDPSSPCYVMTWLALADELQLEELRQMCMCKLRGLAYAGTLEDTLLQRVSPAPTPGSSAGAAGGSILRRDSKRLHDGSGGGAAEEQLPVWHQDDRPELHDSLRQLSRSTLEELLASLAMAASKRYLNRTREDSRAAGGPRTLGSAAAAAAMVDL